MGSIHQKTTSHSNLKLAQCQMKLWLNEYSTCIYITNIFQDFLCAEIWGLCGSGLLEWFFCFVLFTYIFTLYSAKSSLPTRFASLLSWTATFTFAHFSEFPFAAAINCNHIGVCTKINIIIGYPNETSASKKGTI